MWGFCGTSASQRTALDEPLNTEYGRPNTFPTRQMYRLLAYAYDCCSGAPGRTNFRSEHPFVADLAIEATFDTVDVPC